MMCELCGKDFPTLRSVKIEGSVLMVCAACARFGEGVQQAPKSEAPPSAIEERLVVREKRMQERDIYEQAGSDILVEDFPQLIRRRREQLGWSQEELGKRLNERKSIIQKLETGGMMPDDKLTRKIEAVLGLKLKEKAAPAGTSQVRTGQARGLTLGDLIKVERE